MNSEFFFSPSACICVICGQFRIRLRLAVLDNPWQNQGLKKSSKKSVDKN
jgi:hypothetical protein